jgi:hypothetical protein
MLTEDSSSNGSRGDERDGVLEYEEWVQRPARSVRWMVQVAANVRRASLKSSLRCIFRGNFRWMCGLIVRAGGRMKVLGVNWRRDG